MNKVDEDDQNWEEKPEKKKKVHRKKKLIVKKEYERGKYNILDEITKRKIV